MGHHAGSRPPACAGRRRHDAAVDELRNLPARSRPPGVLRSLVEAGVARDARRRRDRERNARCRGVDRRRRPRADDGLAARAARPARVVHRDRAERRAVSRLGDLRAHRDRNGSGIVVRQAVRLQRDLAVEARVRGGCNSACAARPDWIRAAVRAQVRHLGGRRISDLSRVVDGRSRSCRASVDPRRRASRLVLARRRHGRRRHRLVGAARRRLHALLTGQAQRVLGNRDRLLPADAVPVRVWIHPRALTRRRPQSPGAHPRRDRGRRRSHCWR